MYCTGIDEKTSVLPAARDRSCSSPPVRPGRLLLRHLAEARAARPSPQRKAWVLGSCRASPHSPGVSALPSTERALCAVCESFCQVCGAPLIYGSLPNTTVVFTQLFMGSFLEVLWKIDSKVGVLGKKLFVGVMTLN